ncbi:MAG TPA: FAD-binding protein [Streptosporangiaceae bacterium]
MSRRAILKWMSAGAAVAGSGIGSGAAALAATRSQPRLAGTLTTSPEVLSRFATDFGDLVTREPKAVLRPASAGDISAMIQYARASGLKLAMNGQAGGSAADPESHSNYGQALVAGGIAVDAKGLSAIHSLGADSAWVDAGVTWAQLLDAALARGTMFPAHTGYEHLSVGGTASVGGIGPQTTRYGLQVDTISEIEIVTGRGEIVRASATERPDLFNAALGGGGQVGIITKARVRLVPAPTRATVFSLLYHDRHTWFADQEQLVRDGRFDAQTGRLVRNAGNTAWQYQLDGIAYHDASDPPDRNALLAGLRDDRGSAQVSDIPFRDYAFQLDPWEAAARKGGLWNQPHPWLSLLIPGSTVAEFAKGLLAELTPADLGGGFALLSAFGTSKLTRPLCVMPDEPVVYLCDLLRMPLPQDQGVPRMLAQNRRLYDLAVSLGAKRYLIGAIPGMTTQEWRLHFGSEWERLVSAKRRYDPGNVLAPGQGFFG